MPRQTLAERIADLLVAEGVDYLFSLPEVALGRVHHALAERGVPLIANRHEAAGGHMAEAYSLMTGRPTVVGAARGPGIINAVPAVVSAYNEGRPVLFLAPERSAVARNAARRQTFQLALTAELVRPITNYSTILSDPRLADEVFHEAFRAMHTGSLGPAYIGIDPDMLGLENEYEPVRAPSQYRPGTMPRGLTAEEVDRAVALLQGAKSPIVLVGSGVAQAQAHGALQKFVEKFGCAVVATHGGRGILPDTHPQVFDYGLEPGITLTREADLVLAIGTSIGEKLDHGGVTLAPPQRPEPHWWGDDSQRWIHIDRDPAAVGRNRPVDLALVGDAGIVLDQLAERISPVSQTRIDRLAAQQQRRVESYQQLYSEAPDTTPIHSGRAIVEVQKALPENAVVVGGGGLFGLWAMRYRHANISAHVKSQKQGNIGSGTPYALGAALAVRDTGRRVVCIGGDGSFGFYPMELETAVRHQLPVVFVIGYDQGWSDEVAIYMNTVGRTYEVDHAFVRLDDLARSMGAHGEFVTETSEIQPAVQRALESGLPAVVQIIIDRDINAWQLPDRLSVGGGRKWEEGICSSATSIELPH